MPRVNAFLPPTAPQYYLISCKVHQSQDALFLGFESFHGLRARD